MIDVLKRLAELDAQNPNVVRENEPGIAEGQVEECGMMDSMGSMSQPHTPASINMTAASGEELSGMLKDIMSLAGLNNAADEMPVSSEPAAQTLEPAGPEMDATTSMRSVIDKMNPADGEEETDEEYDNSPDPELYGEVPANQDPAGNPGVGDRMDGDRPKAFATMEQQLMAEYKKFISEEQE